MRPPEADIARKSARIQQARGRTVILLKRAYDPASPKDGRRILVERLWPRGITKARLPLDGWLKDVAPSTELRKWFSHDPEKWNEFQRRYRAELKEKPHLWKELLDAARKTTLTLVFSSHDTEHNNAVVLKQFLESHLSQGRKAA
jgi:uncharacterized protein YeaO (DUF488 family)